MKTRIRLIRGAAEEKDIYDKKFNIFLGISLGNKWFTKEHLRVYLRWALDNTKEKVAVMIADKLHAINWEVRNDYNTERAMGKALREGDKFENIIHELISELSEEEKKMIEIIRWQQFEELESHKEGVRVFWEMFENNKDFREKALNIVDKAVNSKSGGREFSGEDVVRLSKYFIEELPEMLGGFEYGGIYYNLYPYPFNLSFGEFVERMQNKEIFPELHDKLNVGKNVLVVLEVEE